jgi:hypothetical protein
MTAFKLLAKLAGCEGPIGADREPLPERTFFAEYQSIVGDLRWGPTSVLIYITASPALAGLPATRLLGPAGIGPVVVRLRPGCNGKRLQ